MTLGPVLPPLTSPSAVYPQCRSHLKWLSFLTAPLQQKVPVLPNTPGCHLHQWLLCGIRNTLGPLLTSRHCDIPLGSAEMVGFAEVGKGKGLGIRSSYNLFPHCPDSWASSTLWWSSIRTTWPNHSGCRVDEMRVPPLRRDGWFLPILLK